MAILTWIKSSRSSPAFQLPAIFLISFLALHGQATSAEVCNIIGQIPKANAPAVTSNIKDVYDHKFVLSWSPHHCESKRIENTKQKKGKKNKKPNTAKWDYKFQCESNSFGFVVHGLWPQAEGGVGKNDNPRNCHQATPLDTKLVKEHLCTVPGVGLMQNEWQAHGTCHWSAPKEYFERIEQLAATFQGPGLTEYQDAEVSVRELVDAIVAANNGALKAEHIAISAQKRGKNALLSLQEVSICLDLVYQPKKCPSPGLALDEVIYVQPVAQPTMATARVTLTSSSSEAASNAAVATRAPADIQCPEQQREFSSYSKQARTAFWTMYAGGGNDVYCAAPFNGNNHRTSTSSLLVNIEHAVPQTLMKGIPAAGGDLHNLWPAMEKINSARQHWRLVEEIPGEVPFFSGRREPELATCDFELQKIGGASIVEPAKAARGPLARSILYMHLAYPAIRLNQQDLAQYLSWHRQYAVTEEEHRRNDEIEALIGTRNPFIDFPQWGESILQACRQP